MAALLAVAEIPDLAGLPGVQEHLEHVVIERPRRVVGMHLEEVDTVRLQPAQAPLDALSHRGGGPGPVAFGVDLHRAGFLVHRVSDLGGEDVFGPSMGDRAADELLAPAVAFGRVEECHAAVQGRVEDPFRVADVQAADLHQSGPESADLESRTSQDCSLHSPAPDGNGPSGAA